MGIDTSNLKTKDIIEFLGRKVDLVVTVCDSAKEACPFFPDATQYEHKTFQDPNRFTGTEEENFFAVRNLRDEISEWIDEEFAP